MRMNERLLSGLLLLLPVAAWAATGRSLPLPMQASVPAAAASAATPSVAARWAALGPAQRRELRAHYAAWRALPETERGRVRAAAAELAALPAEQRQQLYRRYLGLDRLHRAGWRLGPRLGAAYPQLQPLLGYLPQAQREPMLALLHQLDSQQLGLLALLAQRTAPAQRDALRDQLLAVPADERGRWLQRMAEQ